MDVLLYNDLPPESHIKGLTKLRQAIEADQFAQADIRKVGDNLFRAKLNHEGRMLFSFYRAEEKTYCLMLEYLPNHQYDRSRFLNDLSSIDDSKIPAIASPTEVDAEALPYINPCNGRFHFLNKVLSFDDTQSELYGLQPPLVIIGSAGSGKTALTLEKMKHAIGDVLYVSLSAFLVQNSRDLYYAHNYQNEDQNVDFLSVSEFYETWRIPSQKELTLRDFETWFGMHKANSGVKDAHTLFEEFRGVITGVTVDQPYLTRDQYLQLGIKQSIFTEEMRSKVYDLFERYLHYLDSNAFYDPNLLSFEYQSLVQPTYDFLVVDEVQDLTPKQLFLLLKSLRHDGSFLLCGDSNQIVHPNFFSWSKVKTLFFENRALVPQGDLLRVLYRNYRNSDVVTHISNRLLKLKHARFGSVDQESNYLVDSSGGQAGAIRLMTSDAASLKELNKRTSRSIQFAVLVMHPDQKIVAKKYFDTPLVFSIQEAKGLEYQNIILFNFISSNEKAFRDITNGVDPSALEVETLKYNRAKDKRDKSLEIYKFYINALYVAITRAVKNLYFLEEKLDHPLVDLLSLGQFQGSFDLEETQSSADDWQREANKLAMQGKLEQAEEIRQRILHQEPVPWPVLDRDRFNTLWEKLFVDGTKKDKLLAYEYAVLYRKDAIITTLEQQGFKTAKQPINKALEKLYDNHFFVYRTTEPHSLMRDLEKYGVDHRTRFNYTPLMVAASVGNARLVETLISLGSHTQLVNNCGQNALHIALQRACHDPKYAKLTLPTLFKHLEPKSLSVQVDGRLIKIDCHLMALFLFHIMVALFSEVFSISTLADATFSSRRGFSAKLLTKIVSRLPGTVLPAQRKRQQYISSILSSNEVDRDYHYNRKLFKRLSRGYYMINPDMEIKINDRWVKIPDLLGIEITETTDTYPPHRMFSFS